MYKLFRKDTPFFAVKYPNQNPVCKIILILLLLSIMSCSRQPVLVDKGPLFLDYTRLESAITSSFRFPNEVFTRRYDNFIEDYQWNGSLTDIQDGVYESYSEPDARGYLHYVNFTVVEGRFESVFYDEFKIGDNTGKSTSDEFNEFLLNYTGATAEEAFPLFAKQLISKQDPLAVDGVSGATKSCYRFKVLILKSLYEARNDVVLNREYYSGGQELMRN